MNLDGICELEFRSSERRRWVRWARGYKHFTPPGWRAVPRDLDRLRKGFRNLRIQQEVMVLYYRDRPEA